MKSESESGTLLSDDIRTFIRTRAWPKKLVVVTVEYEDHLGLRFFRGNFNSFEAADRMQIAMMVKETMEKIRKIGIPIYLEVVAGHG